LYQIIFTGSANAFYSKPDNFQSNFLIQAPNERLFLVDCGSDIRRALYALGYDSSDIDYVYVSHLHNDHVGGLDWLGLTRYYHGSLSKPNLYLVDDLLPLLWDQYLGTLMTLENDKSTLTDFFIPHVIPKQQSFDWEGVRFSPVFSYHAMSDGTYIPCYGLWIEFPGTRVWFTSDCQFQFATNQRLYEQADFILHDCETSDSPSGVHAHYQQLNTLPQSIKSKVYLYHSDTAFEQRALDDGFLGFIQPGKAITVL
jgi:ribonuclease BN (tRNA processing enzyme)